MEQFAHKDIELLAQRLYCVVGVLAQLLTVLNLRLKQLPQLFIVIFQLLAFQCLSENVFAVVRKRAYLLALSTCNLRRLLIPALMSCLRACLTGRFVC